MSGSHRTLSHSSNKLRVADQAYEYCDVPYYEKDIALLPSVQLNKTMTQFPHPTHNQTVGFCFLLLNLAKTILQNSIV